MERKIEIPNTGIIVEEIDDNDLLEFEKTEYEREELDILGKMKISCQI